MENKNEEELLSRGEHQDTSKPKPDLSARRSYLFYLSYEHHFCFLFLFSCDFLSGHFCHLLRPWVGPPTIHTHDKKQELRDKYLGSLHLVCQWRCVAFPGLHPSLPLGLLGRHAATLLLQHGQDGGLLFSEGRHLLQHSGLEIVGNGWEM